ncbi:(2Fe-2S) ferredoxin domain-containing protein [Devosia sp. 2618]|uniref:(2Fe-2S) ferredoxin domain-containing protein n=1 Tax=Devosia sp. 2618 TaxID=3156454 RepID=UPI0033933DBB
MIMRPALGRVMQPDAILFVISLANLSARRFATVANGLAAATALPSRLVRLEGTDQNLPQALDALRDEGHTSILVQPIGLPFPESLIAWLPGALATWSLLPGNDDVTLSVGSEASDDPALLSHFVTTALENADNATPVAKAKPSLGKPGWQNPPDFRHHLLVCTGPRCHYRDAASLLHALKDETNRQGIASQCLTARTGCLFPCNQGPMVALYPKGEWYRLADKTALARFVSEVLVQGQTAHDLLIHTAKAARQPALSTKDNS